MPSVAFATLGCKVNQYDTQALQELFARQGFRVVPFEGPADVYVVNTCAVTGEGERQSRQVVRRAVRRSGGGAAVVVTGCLAQLPTSRLASIPGVAAVVGTQRRAAVVEAAQAWLAGRRGHAPERPGLSDGAGSAPAPAPAVAASRGRPRGPYEELGVESFTGRSRAVVKVQDGCDEMCTFCVVPFTRGVSRSRAPQAVVEEVRRLVERGYRELVLSGVHLGSYGEDLPRRTNLVELLMQLEELPGPFRLRLSSLLPSSLSPQLVDWWGASRRLCPHIHLSLQSGDDGVLAAMGRSYTADWVREAVAALRRRRPDLSVSADVIVGFPGESERAFAATAQLVDELEVARLHVFPYSPRPFTAAARLPDDVPARVKRERVRELVQVAERAALRYHRRLVGHLVQVLVEDGPPGPAVHGVDEHYVRVQLRLHQGLSFPGEPARPQPGQLVAARVVEAGTHRVEAVCLPAAGEPPQQQQQQP